ncbi:TfoX/Sxy family protein [Rhodobacter sp. NSM]|uniref:TfoX/Sxy family protein n=1 Tax=Rhodobacter sp. NSM TaxID=3457501 RepID=UPI003FD168B1
MATDPRTAAQIADALRDAGAISLRRMFGEYAVYLDGRVVGFICDDQLFLKDLPEARAFLPEAATGRPYPGARLYIAIADELDDEETLVRAVRALAEVLPVPALRKRKDRASGQRPAKPEHG